MLGDTYNNNKKKGNYSPMVYSRYSFANSESKIDPAKMSFTFWNGLLKIAIAPFIEDKLEYDYDNEGAIYISHFKAKMLAEEISLFLANPEEYKNRGITSGDGLISVSNGVEVTGKTNPCIIIRKIGEDGKPSASYLYEFRNEYHYSVRNYNESDSDFDKVYNNNLELEMFKQILIDYYQSMSGALAYSVIDYNRFNNSRVNTKLDSIAEKLGISYGKGKNNSRGRSSSIFDNAEGRSYTNKDIDDIENEM